MPENHEHCYAGNDQDTHEVKHSSDAVIDVKSCPALQFLATVHSHISGIVSEWQKWLGAVELLHYDAAAPFFDHWDLQQTLSIPLNLLLPQIP